MPHASRFAPRPSEPLHSDHPDAGRVLPGPAPLNEAGATHRITLVELRVLAAGAGLGAPAPLPGAARRVRLDEHERRTRLDDLVSLWQGGCRRLVDETLYHDIAARHPELARTVRRRLRRRRFG